VRAAFQQGRMPQRGVCNPMEDTLRIPDDWAVIGVQRPLFLEHTHAVAVKSIRLAHPERVCVKWRCVGEDELAGREFSETFNFSGGKGKERLKGFLFAIPVEAKSETVDLDACLGRTIKVIALRRPARQTERLEIIHHLL